jgi:CAAX protease family protein
VENSSTSRLSPAWPTTWPTFAFSFAPTALVIVAAVVISLVVFLLGAAILAMRLPLHHGTHLPPEQLIMFGTIIQFAVEVPLVAFLFICLPWLSGFRLRELGFRMPTWPVVAIALVGAVAMIVVANGTAALIDLATHAQHEQAEVILFKQVHDPRVILFFSFFAVTIAPIAEETVFRVFLFNIGLRYWGFWIGALISGLLFGLAHADKFALVPLALGGIVLSGVYYYSRNAFASMISHGLFNAVSVIGFLYAQPHMPHR